MRHISEVLLWHLIGILGPIAALYPLFMQQREKKKLLIRSGEQYKTIIQASPVPILIYQENKIVLANDEFQKLINKNATDIIGKDFLDFLNSESKKRFIEIMNTKERALKVNLKLENKYKQITFIEVTTNEITFGQKEAVQILINDITNRKQAEETIKFMAYYDLLTGLPNRTYFNEKLEESLNEFKEGDFLAVLMLDLDNFKKVNDTLGHSAGDQLLIHVSNILTRNIRREIDIVCRISGDEFTIILRYLEDDESIEGVAQKMIDELREPWEFEGYRFQISASMGIKIIDDKNLKVEEIFKSCDVGMYYAKDRGKNNFVIFDDTMQERINNRQDLESALHKAVERNEFILHYQPQMDINTGKTIGLEALVRWERPGHGMISPFFFIPIAEETGLIWNIGEIVLRETCRQIKIWEEEGVEKVRIGVNISPRQFQRSYFVDVVRSIIDEYKIDPTWLEFEITESVMMEDLDYTINMLNDIKKIGIRISIDDFGTGYSSLNYLKNLPIDKLKIDKSFVDDILVDDDDSAIIKTVISMSQNLKMTSIAEGVETLEQLDRLREYQCDEIQGWYYSKPLPAQDVKKFLNLK